MVARYLGVVEAVGSNPATQTKESTTPKRCCAFFFCLGTDLNTVNCYAITGSPTARKHSRIGREASLTFDAPCFARALR